jgi:subtilase family serine protease
VIVQGYFSDDSSLSAADSAACGVTISTVPLVISGDGTTDVQVGCGLAPPPGANYLIVDVDSGGILAERNESNNTLAVPLGVDLTVTSVVAEGASSGGDFTWSATIENLGGVPYSNETVPSAAVIQAYLSADDVLDSSDTSLAFCRTVLADPDLVLRAGESTEVHVACHAQPAWGADYLLVVADSLNGVPESDETNNVGSQLTPAVDLTDVTIVVDTPAGSPYFEYVVSMTLDSSVPIQIQGLSVAGAYSADETLGVGDNPACGFTVPFAGIAQPGDVIAVRVQCTEFPTSNDFWLIVNADSGDVIHESDESNNQGRQSLIFVS